MVLTTAALADLMPDATQLESNKEYFLFSPKALTLAGYRLVNGPYEAIAPNSQGHLWSQALAMFLGVQNNQLRYFTAEGALVPTPDESAIRSESQAQVDSRSRRSARCPPDNSRPRTRSLRGNTTS